MGVKLARWIIFGAIVSLLPLVFAWITLVLASQTDPPRDPELKQIVGNGELLVIIWVLSATAIGELFGSGGGLQIPKIITGGFTLIVIILAAGLFVWTVDERALNRPVNEALLVRYSIYMFISSIVCSIGCLLCSAEE
jgi:hypothetical protein